MSKTLNLTPEDQDALKRIRALMDQIDKEFVGLSEDAKEQVLDFHNENTSLNHCVRWGLNAVNELVADCEMPLQPLFGYYINLDERGDFYADVRDTDGKTLYEIKAGSSLGEDESSIFDDGFMKDKNDIAGLTIYLRSLDIIPANGQVLGMDEFEKEEESRPRMRT